MRCCRVPCTLWFARIIAEGRPVTGCQVMERESFENEDIAKLLNENFVPIKVDREERPDIDRIYMNFVSRTCADTIIPT